MGDVHDYIAGGYEKVPGWWAPQEPVLFSLVNTTQQATGTTGDLLEIGVYKGRSAVLLGYLASPDEEFVACDVFGGAGTNAYSDEENAAYYDGLSVDEFKRNYLSYHQELPRIVIGPSTVLPEHCKPSSYRIIHIDGSHMYPDVRHDLLLSRELAAGPDAVVIVDDIHTPHTPGVWAAAWECVFNEGLVPHIVSGKMYATWGTPSDDFQTRLTRLVDEHPKLEVARHPLDGREVRQVGRLARPSTKGRLAQDWLPPAVLRRVSRG